MFAALAPHVGESLDRALKDPGVAAIGALALEPVLAGFPAHWLESLALDLRYEGYIAKEDRLSARLGKMDRTRLPLDLDYKAVLGLSTESAEKLALARPLTLGQASRVPGVRPSDVALLAVRLGAKS